MRNLLSVVACLLSVLFVCAVSCTVAQAAEEEKLPGQVGKALAPDELKQPGGKEEKKPEAGEEEKGFAERTQDKLSEFSGPLDRAFKVVAERKVLGLVAVLLLTFLGGLLLLFGWRLLNALFLPFSALVGAALGGFLGFQLAVALSFAGGTGTAVVAGLVGAVSGGLLFAGASVKAQPVAWMLIVSAPFLVVSTFLVPMGTTGQFLAIGTVVVGLGLGFASMMKRQQLVVFSTALLGAICLAFCFGVVTRLTESPALVKALEFTYKYPFALLGAVGLLTLLGADLQFVLAPSEAFSGEEVEDVSHLR